MNNSFLPRIVSSALTGAFVSAFIPAAALADHTWTAATAGNWNANSNWTGTPAGAPASTGNIAGTTTGSQINVNGTRVINDFTNNWTGTWTVNGSNTGGNSMTVDGTLYQSSTGTLLIRQGNSTNQSLAVTVANINVSSGALNFGTKGTQNGASVNSLSVTGVTTVSGGELAVNSAAASYSLGRLNLTGGEVILNSRPTMTVTANVTGLSGTGAGTINGSSGSAGVVTLQVANSTDYATNAVLINGSGTSTLRLVKSGSGKQTLQGASTYSGGTEIQAGILEAGHASALGTGVVTVNGSGTLLISAATVGVGDVTVSGTGGVDLGGATITKLSLTTGSDFAMSAGTLKFSYLAGNYDQILGTATGVFTFANGVLDLGNSAWDYAQTYTLFSGFGSGSISNISFTNYDTANYVASLDNSGVLSFEAVPEPSVFALAALGLSLVVWRRRKIRVS